MLNFTKTIVLALLLHFAFPLVASAINGPIDYSPTSLAFGLQVVGTGSASQQISLHNITAYWISIRSITVPGDYSQTNSCGNGINFQQYCTITVTFFPATQGIKTGSVTVKYSVSTNPNYIYTLTISLSGEGVLSGFVNPKYQILSIEYAPPGLSSSASYGNDTVVGNSTDISSSYSDEHNKSVSVTAGHAFPGFTTSITLTNSTSYKQEQDTSTTIAVSQTSSLTTGVNGVETPAGTNHDFDIIRVWLNPILSFGVDSTTNPPTVVWTGVGYDMNDSATYPYEEVVEVKMGCLNGHISASDSNCSYFFGRAQRTWALNNVDGSGPALTGDGAACVPNSGSDICNILAADPFSNPSYTITFTPPSLTTNDVRFTACHDNPNCVATIPCVPGTFAKYSQGYSSTITLSETSKYTYSQTYAVEVQFKGTQFLDGFGASLKDSNTVTSSHSFNHTTNGSQGQTAEFTIQPSSSYPGQQGFDIYQDNIFGTFIFWPIPK